MNKYKLVPMGILTGILPIAWGWNITNWQWWLINATLWTIYISTLE